MSQLWHDSAERVVKFRLNRLDLGAAYSWQADGHTWTLEHEFLPHICTSHILKAWLLLKDGGVEGWIVDPATLISELVQRGMGHAPITRGLVSEERYPHKGATTFLLCHHPRLGPGPVKRGRGRPAKSSSRRTTRRDNFEAAV